MCHEKGSHISQGWYPSGEGDDFFRYLHGCYYVHHIGDLSDLFLFRKTEGLQAATADEDANSFLGQFLKLGQDLRPLDRQLDRTIHQCQSPQFVTHLFYGFDEIGDDASPQVLISSAQV